jgi:thiol:disulfide interchange protein DsbA
MALTKRNFGLIAGSLILSLASSFAWAQSAAAYVEGRDYTKYTQPKVLLAKPGKVEIIEFFWYGCPHCYRLHGPMSQWVERNADKINYITQPAVLGKNWEIMARAYHAMVGAGGYDAALSTKLFTSIHEKKMPIQELTGDEPKALYELILAEKGKAYADKFKQEYAGFGMGQKLARDRELQKIYGLEGTPTVVVAGKYAVDPGMAGGEEKMVPIIDYLFKKSMAEMKP